MSLSLEVTLIYVFHKSNAARQRLLLLCRELDWSQTSLDVPFKHMSIFKQEKQRIRWYFKNQSTLIAMTSKNRRFTNGLTEKVYKWWVRLRNFKIILIKSALALTLCTRRDPSIVIILYWMNAIKVRYLIIIIELFKKTQTSCSR